MCRRMQAALAEHQEKDKLAKERIPEVEEHHRKITRLTEEYDHHVEYAPSCSLLASCFHKH